jgi:hypothetical protein
MMALDGVTLLATVCNTTPNAVPYSLWLARGAEQYVVDLSGALGRPGDLGLTGLTWHGDRIYAAVQSSATPRILVLDRHLAVVGVISSPEFADLHSLHTFGDSLVVCSTGHRSVVQLSIADHGTALLCQFEAMVHLNSASLSDTALLLCCHYPGHIVPEATGGGVINLTSGHMLLDGLGQPHSLQRLGDEFLVLDSEGERIIRFDNAGIRQQQALSGFLRGITAARGSLFTASSVGRVISRKNPVVPPARRVWETLRERVTIFELDAITLEIKAQHHPLMAGFEIYDLLALDADQAVDPPLERLIVPEPNVIARMYYESAKTALAARQQRT